MHANEIKARWMTFLTEYCDVGALAINWPEQRSLVISFRELYNFDQDFAEIFLNNPNTFLKTANSALLGYVKKKITK